MIKVTIREIAKHAGVSTTSVSFAFNNPDRLSAETVQKILEVADQLGYIPNPIARSMTSGRTGTIGVLLPQPLPEIFKNPFIMEFLEGVGEICTRDGYSLMLIPPLEGSIKRAIEFAAVDGFMTLGIEEEKSVMAFLKQRKVPFVVVDSDSVSEVSSVNVDDKIGAEQAMLHLLEYGHTSIAIVGMRSGKNKRYEEYIGIMRKRIDGYQYALEKHGMSIEDPSINLFESDNTMKNAKQVFKRVISTDPKPTAIIAMSDIIALGIIEAANIENVHIPDEISVVGFDNIPLAKLVNPPLTTVSQPIREKGRISANLLSRRIGGDTDFEHVILPTQLVIRGSTKKN